MMQRVMRNVVVFRTAGSHTVREEWKSDKFKNLLPMQDIRDSIFCENFS